jgi:hypothetical protein
MKIRDDGMILRLSTGSRIDNPRNYAAKVVKDLAHLLTTGGSAQPDLRRENFYELDGEYDTYYIHISPISGNAVLLAKWSRQPQENCIGAAHAIE